ncbi:MAG TPA: hypothetical protein VK249_23770 [Anaerolineales bacterium]|nr:hypothetical protein [Anaerolineales bacterium]
MKQKLILPLGIVILFLLIGGFTIWLQRASRPAPTAASLPPAFQINVPTVQYPTIPPSDPAFTVPIYSVASSGVTGTVTFKDIAGTVAILLHVDGLPQDEESEGSVLQVELHYGTCADPGALAYPMTAPDAGESETDLSINLKQFNQQRPMAVLLYRSPQDHTVIACGDIS